MLHCRMNYFVQVKHTKQVTTNETADGLNVWGQERKDDILILRAKN